ncbi:MAG: bifunctional demethylmenaquinone methyltransferase/2-methoxy-6-polyprenyl-1,4-benzoquinol methylase UbiE [Deltaproteobacteria bacterium]|nr:bifunctional demethylmenaquinone methyltransferase/2-methoxy-6-polyprenyl-1,4-benzoquinol methylase UbiE [Deltaproteobacteria bacterium]
MSEEKKTTHFGYKVIPEEEKKGRIADLFTSVAASYDLMNDLMSLGTHRLWKKYVAEKTGLKQGESALDVAGGTADIALLLAGKVGEGGRVVVYDINRGMLLRGRDKCIDRGFLKNIRFVQGDAENISFEDNTFHCVTIGFGVRNFTHLEKAFREMYRVVKPGGKVVCLEFSHVGNPLLRKLYDLYSFNFIPFAGEKITGDRDAYTYLPESIRKFPKQEELKEIMEGAGLFRVKYHNIFNGIAAVHIGAKV